MNANFLDWEYTEQYLDFRCVRVPRAVLPSRAVILKNHGSHVPVAEIRFYEGFRLGPADRDLRDRALARQEAWLLIQPLLVSFLDRLAADGWFPATPIGPAVLDKLEGTRKEHWILRLLTFEPTTYLEIRSAREARDDWVTYLGARLQLKRHHRP